MRIIGDVEVACIVAALALLGDDRLLVDGVACDVDVDISVRPEPVGNAVLDFVYAVADIIDIDLNLSDLSEINNNGYVIGGRQAGHSAVFVSCNVLIVILFSTGNNKVKVGGAVVLERLYVSDNVLTARAYGCINCDVCVCLSCYCLFRGCNGKCIYIIIWFNRFINERHTADFVSIGVVELTAYGNGRLALVELSFGIHLVLTVISI